MLWLALAGLAAALLALECGVRVAGSLADARELARARARAAAPPGAEAELGDLIRPSSDPRIVYELIPGLATQFRGAALATSSQGLRDREYPVERPPGSVRIVGIGDSVMFGWGVPEEATFLARLEARLNAEHPARRWEVINAAVPGYNAVMEVASLREKGLRFQPDVVVMDFVHNDINLPNFLLLPDDWWTPRRSYLVELVRRRLSAQPWLRGSRFVHTSPWARERDPDRVPPAYRDHVGWGAYKRALAELAELSRAHGFEVFVSGAAGPLSVYARQRIEPHGFRIVDDRAAMARSGGEGADVASLRVLSADDPHPSPLGHQLTADALYGELVASGTVARLERRMP
jgi:lysophospholipase L1-like esterase